MHEDDPEDGEKHEATTVPPPAGESDIYEAKTQVGGLPPEALDLLRKMKDEAPSGNAGSIPNLPIFVDDEEPVPFKPRPAAGTPAVRRPDSDPVPNVFVPSTAPARKGDSVPPLVPQMRPAAMESETYAAVFAPLPPSTAVPTFVPATVPGQPSRALVVVVVLAAVLVAGLAIILLTQSGLLPGGGVAPPAPSH